MRSVVQVDDGYPSDRILLKERISVIAYLNDTLLVKNQPCPDLATPGGLEHRRKLAPNTYQFAYLPGCAGAAGDLFVVRLPISHAHLLCNLRHASALMHAIAIHLVAPAWRGIWPLFQGP